MQFCCCHRSELAVPNLSINHIRAQPSCLSKYQDLLSSMETADLTLTSASIYSFRSLYLTSISADASISEMGERSHNGGPSTELNLTVSTGECVCADTYTLLPANQNLPHAGKQMEGFPDSATQLSVVSFRGEHMKTVNL